MEKIELIIYTLVFILTVCNYNWIKRLIVKEYRVLEDCLICDFRTSKSIVGTVVYFFVTPPMCAINLIMTILEEMIVLVISKRAVYE